MNNTKLIVISGLPGSGKSTVAEGLAAKLFIPIFSVDPIESAIRMSGIERSFATGLAAYLVAETLAGEQLKCGMSAIIDAVNPVQEARDMWPALARKYAAKLIIIECVLEEALHKQRIEARIRNMPGFAEVTWEEVTARRQEYLPWQEEHLSLDTASSSEENIARALAYIQSAE